MIKVFNGKMGSLYPSAIARQRLEYNATHQPINLSTYKHKKRAGHRPALLKVSPPGLEPGARWLRVICSTNWATETFIFSNKFELPRTWGPPGSLDFQENRASRDALPNWATETFWYFGTAKIIFLCPSYTSPERDFFYPHLYTTSSKSRIPAGRFQFRIAV